MYISFCLNDTLLELKHDVIGHHTNNVKAQKFPINIVCSVCVWHASIITLQNWGVTLDNMGAVILYIQKQNQTLHRDQCFTI